MAINLKHDDINDDYYPVRTAVPTHVAWSLDDLPRLAADIHRTVLALVVHGAACADVDAAIVDCLRGTTPDSAGDTVTGHD